jgi:outer membrane usher protein
LFVIVDAMLSDPGAQPADLHLAVTINGYPTQLIAHCRRRDDGSLAIDKKELGEIGLKSDERALASDGLFDFSRLPGVRVRYEEAKQILSIEAIDAALLPHRIDAVALRGSLAPSGAPASGRGAVLNYLLFGTTDARAFTFDTLANRASATATLDGRLFSEFGVLSQSAIFGLTPYGSDAALRLDTTWRYDDPDALVSYRAGDIISGGLAWTRPVRLGGVQIQRSFALRPDLVTAPLPSLGGSAAVPSTVDVYLNNLRTFSHQVPAGPFEISNIPVISGAGTLQMVVRDATGRETAVTQQIFASSKLLRPGLYDFSVETGVRRYSFGALSQDYDGSAVAAASLRGALSDRLTLETHAEGGSGLANAGAGAVFGLGAAGVGAFAFAASRYGGEFGTQIAASVESQFGDLRLFGRAQRSFGSYNDLASAMPPSRFAITPGRDYYRPPRALYQVALTMPLLTRSASITANFAHLDTDYGVTQNVLGLSYSRPLTKNSNVFLTGFTDLSTRDSYGLFGGITVALTSDISARGDLSVSGRDGTGGIDVAKSLSSEPGSFGWRVRDSEGSLPNRGAAGSYRSSFGRVAAGFQQYGTDQRVTGELEGALVAMNGSLFASNRIDDAFAIVDAGAPGVAVSYENRPAGQTGSDGRLLVPRLRSYENNVLAIDPTNLPVGASVDQTRLTARPRSRSGVLVDFGVNAKGTGILVTLRYRDGSHVEAGSAAQIGDHGETLAVGYDGQIYIPDLGGDAVLAVKTPRGISCGATIHAPHDRDGRIVKQSAVCQ